MVLSSTIAPGGVTRPTPEADGDGVALGRLLVLAAGAVVADRLGLGRPTVEGVTVGGRAALDGATARTTGVTAAGPLVAGAGPTGGAPLDAGAAADEIGNAGAPVEERLAVQAVTSTV